MYANHRGCDGTRLYFDGSSLVAVNGHLVAQASQFSLKEVEVLSCVVDLEEVRCHRQASGSLQEQSAQSTTRSPTFPVLFVDFSLCLTAPHGAAAPTQSLTAVTFHCKPAEPMQPRIHRPEEECLRGPACWLWDYLRRSGAGGFLLPLSGGADSSSVCSIVYTMCLMAVQAAAEGDLSVKAKVLSLCPALEGELALKGELALEGEELKKWHHKNAQTLCNSVLVTTYLGTKNSSHLTRDRAAKLAGATGAYHSPLYIDAIVDAVLHVFSTLTPSPPTPRFLVHGG